MSEESKTEGTHMSESKRRGELSLMNVLLCLFVIFIHVSSHAVSHADRASWQYAAVMIPWRLCACAVPGFFFLSGLKFALTAKPEFSFGRYLLGRVKRVLVPYILCAVVYWLYFLRYNYMTFSIPEFLKLLADGNLSSHFYFIIAVMQFYLLAPLWRQLLRVFDRPVNAVIALVLALPVGLIYGQYLADYLLVFYQDGIFPYTDRVFTTYILWWMLGLTAGKYYDSVRAFAAERFRGISVLYGLAAVQSAYLSWLHFSGRMSIWWLETMHTFYVLCAVLFFYALSVKLAGTKLAAFRLTSLIDRTSFSIYLWHPLALYLADQVLAYIPAPSILLVFAVRAAFAFGGTIAVCAGVHVVTGMLKKKA